MGASLFKRLAPSYFVTTVAQASGFGRDIAIASLLGPSLGVDRYLSAAIYPNMAALVIQYGVLPALIPFLVEFPGRSRRAVMLLSSGAALMGLALELVVLLVVTAGSGGGVRSIVERQLGWTILLLTPAFALAPAQAVVAGGLQVSGRSALSLASPLMTNAAIVIGLLLVEPAIHADALPIATSLGMTLMLLVSLLQLRLPPDDQKDGPRFPFLFKHALAPLLTLGLQQAVVILERVLALAAASGVVLVLDLAFRLVWQSFALLFVATNAVLYPAASAAIKMRGAVEGRRFAMTELRPVLALALIPALVAHGLSLPLVRLVYERGQFSPGAAGLTAALVSTYALALVPAVASEHLSRLSFAAREYSAPVVASGIRLLVTAAVDITLFPLLGVEALAIGYLAGVLIYAVGLAYMAVRASLDRSECRWWTAFLAVTGMALAGQTVLVGIMSGPLEPTAGRALATIVSLALAALGAWKLLPAEWALLAESTRLASRRRTPP